MVLATVVNAFTIFVSSLEQIVEDDLAQDNEIAVEQDLAKADINLLLDDNDFVLVEAIKNKVAIEVCNEIAAKVKEVV